MEKDQEKARTGRRPLRNPKLTARPASYGAGGGPTKSFSASQFSKDAEPWESFGDLFPWPLPREHGYEGGLAGLASRRSRQRVARRRLLLENEKESVRCLNRLAGFEDERFWPAEPRNFAQLSSLGVVHMAHQTRAPPVEQESPQAALRQLLRKKVPSCYDEGGGPGRLVGYERSKVSLPRGQHEPVDLARLLPPLEKMQLDDFEQHMLLSGEEMAAVLEKGLESCCYLDPVLASNKKAYHQFIGDLVRCELVSFTQTPRVQIGAFFVSKKGDKQRLVIDARRANRLFRTPPSTALGSIDCWSRLEVSQPNQLFIAQEDVKDYFYRLRITKELGEYFALPQVDVQALKQELQVLPPHLVHLCDHYDAPIYPHLQVLPMGFSWAFHLAHMAHTELARRCLPRAPPLVDRKEAPVIGDGENQVRTAVMIYADNANHIGNSRDEVSSDQQKLLATLHEHGLDTHDLLDSSVLAESLGVRIDGVAGRVTPTPSRDWRLDRALAGLAFHRPWISGEELEVIVGHMTVRALLHRGLMGVLRHAYVFIRTTYRERQKLWPSVARELQLFRGLMPLGTADIFAEWDYSPICTDACLTGYAVMESCHSAQVAATMGRSDERWRFRLGQGTRVAPRVAALDTAQVFSDPLSVKPTIDGEIDRVVYEDMNFPEVEPSFLHEGHWHKLWNAPVYFKEPVHMIEARSILAAVKHRSKDHLRHRRRITFLNDNLGVVLALQKGRCHNYGLLRIVRRIAAHSLATGQKYCARWIPSERNVADKDSRQWEFKRRQKSRVGHEAGIVAEEGDQSVQQGPSASFKCQNEFSRGSPPIAQKEPEPFQTERVYRDEAKQSGFEANGESSRKEKNEGSFQTKEALQEVASSSWREDASRDGQRQGGAAQRLCEEARCFLQLRCAARAPAEKSRRPRHSNVRLRGRALSEWGERQRGGEIEGSHRIRKARRNPSRRADLAPIQEGDERMAEARSHSGSNAHAGVPEVKHQWTAYSHGGETDGALPGDHLFNICPARGAVENPTSGHRAKQCPIQPRCDRLESHGARGVLQGRHLRRDPRPGRHSRPMVGTVAAQSGFGQDREEERRHASLGLHGTTVSQEMETLCRNPGDSRCSAVPLSEQTWGSKQRPSLEAADDTGHTEAREMGERCKRSHLQQAGQASADSESIQSEISRLWRRHSTELPALLPEWHCPDAKRPQKEVQAGCAGRRFLSLFGGVSNPAKIFAKRGGCAAVIDFAFSPLNDLSKPSKWNRIMQVLHLFDIIGIDIPCNTWSRARRAPAWSRMPKALRSDQYTFGLPGLSAKDQKLVEQANVMFFGAVRVIRRCLKQNIPGYLENPATSRLWQTPQMKRLLQDPRCHLIRADMCQYACSWKKPTLLLFWNVTAPLFRICLGTHTCSRTHRRHVQLSGIAGKRFLTHQAQIYSLSFSQALIDVFCPQSPPTS